MPNGFYLDCLEKAIAKIAFSHHIELSSYEQDVLGSLSS